MRPYALHFIAIAMVAVAAAGSLRAGTPEAMSLLKANCFACHNDEKKKGGLVLTTREAMLRGGENGAVVVMGKAA
ncbi:MAG: hypothetical protein EXS22_01170, partial [Pedosphaera sp.]|nr:hypothetical protein [Pedosphaera sp.]